MKQLQSILAVCILLLAICAAVPAQQTPYSFASIAPKITFANEIGYRTPGVGGEISVGIALPNKLFGLDTHTLYGTEDVEMLKEEKTFLHDGRTIGSVTGLNCHFKDHWFGRAAFSVGNHSNSAYSKTATRLQFGGGYSYQSREPVICNGCLLALRVTAVGFVPVSDPNAGRGLKLSVDGFMPVVRSGLWGVHWKGGIAGGSFKDSSAPFRRHWANYGDAAFGVFLNLSAIAGS